MRFLSHNLELYTFNSTIHNYKPWNRIQLHKPSAALTIYQKWLYYESLKIFSNLLYDIAEMILQKKNFMAKLKKYLIAKAFYSTEEYMNDRSDR
jgi:alanine-alpha-ketoisovalerate/valine-pyruvate aminotransferase